MHLGSVVRPELIFPRLPAGSREELLRLLAQSIAEAGAIDDPENLYRMLLEREELGSTGIGGGVAIPHCKYDDLDSALLVVGITSSEIDFDAADGKPVRLFFVVASPEKAPAEHLKMLAAISKWVRMNDHVERILKMSEPSEIHALLSEESDVER